MYAIVAQLDRAFGSDPEGQRFESSRSHQEKPEHIRVLVFLFWCAGEDSNSNNDDRSQRLKQGGVVGAAFWFFKALPRGCRKISKRNP